MGFQGIPQHGKFAWSGVEKAVEEVINLGGIDGKQGKAGVKMSAGESSGASASALSAEDQPSGGSSRLPDDGRNFGRVDLLERLHQTGRRPQCAR